MDRRIIAFCEIDKQLAIDYFIDKTAPPYIYTFREINYVSSFYISQSYCYLVLL